MWRRLYGICEGDLLAFRWLYRLDSPTDGDTRDDEYHVVLFRAANPAQGVCYGKRSYIYRLICRMDPGTPLAGVVVWVSCMPKASLPANRIERAEHYVDSSGRPWRMMRRVRLERCSQCAESVCTDERMQEDDTLWDRGDHIRSVQTGPSLLKCAACVGAPARYCSRECQQQHWRAGHKLWHASGGREGAAPVQPTLTQSEIPPLALSPCSRCERMLTECECGIRRRGRKYCEVVD